MQHYISNVLDIFGNAVNGATIHVYAAGTTTPSTIYSDNNGTSITNPLTSGTDGSFGFYAATGRYDLVITHPSHTFTDADTAGIALYDPTDAPTDWTPSLGGTTTYAVRVGKAVKFGRLVHISCSLLITAIGTGSQNVITGLPYTAAGYNQGLAVGFNQTLASAVVSVNAVIGASGTQITVYGRAAADASAQAVAIFGDNTQIDIVGTYIAAS